jgi:hypothetical protein
MQQPKTIQVDLSLDEMRWFLGGVTRARVAQLEQDGILQRTERGRYQTSGIPAFIKLQREVGGGSRELQAAKLENLLEKNRAAKFEREIRMRQWIPLGPFIDWLTHHFGGIKLRLLAMPSKLAAQLAVCSTAGECETVMRKELYEVLDDLAISPPEFGEEGRRKINTAYDDERRLNS